MQFYAPNIFGTSMFDFMLTRLLHIALLQFCFVPRVGFVGLCLRYILDRSILGYDYTTLC